MKSNKHFWSYLAQFFLEWEMFQKKIVEEIKTCNLCSIIFFLKSAFYEIMWKNIVQQGRPETTIWRMRIAISITKTTDTLATRNTYCFSTATMVARTRLKVSLRSPGKFDVVFPTYFRYGSRLKLLQHVGEASTVCVLTGLQVKLWTFPSSVLFINNL